MKDLSRQKHALLLGLSGLLISLSAPLWLPGWMAPSALFCCVMTLLVFLGMGLRVARRKCFFGSKLSLHQAFSFELLFQGMTLLFPQIAYPTVESAFLISETGLPASEITPWFRVRTASAIVTPSALLGVFFLLVELPILASVFWVISLGAWVYFTLLFHLQQSTSIGGTSRFAAAIGFGLLAALGEGALFIQAAQALSSSSEQWEAFLLYVAILGAFEVSPIPLALGIIELTVLVLSSVPLVAVAGGTLASTYRLWRGVPVLLIMLFYLPRYKLALMDLFDPQLALGFKRSWQTEHPHEEEGKPLLSVVIPAFDEEKRLPSYLPEVLAYCSRFKRGAEVCVVDDGSHDGTAAYVTSLVPRYPLLRLLKQPQNQGKGAAVRRGVLESQGAYILFADADGSTPIAEVDRLLVTAQQGAELVIASRAREGSQVSRSPFRDLMGSIFYRLTNLLAVPGVEDTQCGFKLLRRGPAHHLFRMLQEEGWAFDVELLYLAQKLGMSIVEVPIAWRAVEGSKVHPVWDSLQMLRALMRIRQRWSGLSPGGD